MTKPLAGLLLAALFLGACADRVIPTGSPAVSVVPASDSPPASTASAVPSGLSASPPGSSPAASAPAPAATPSPSPTATATATPTAPPPLSEYPQSWSGTWEDPVTGGSGSIEITLIGRGSGFGGSITMDGTACLANGILSGSYDGRDIEFSVGQRDVEIRFVGTADDAVMAGTFVTDCDAMDGTWRVTRTDR